MFFNWQGFTGQSRLAHIQILGLQQAHISWHHVPCRQENHIPWN